MRLSIESPVFDSDELVMKLDQMQKQFRDKGLIGKYVRMLIANGIGTGIILQIGCSHNLVGLELLKSTTGTMLYWHETNQKLVDIATRNSEEYGLSGRIQFIDLESEAIRTRHAKFFDSVFSKNNLCQWKNPLDIFNMISMITKDEGVYYITDGKRNINRVVLNMLTSLMVKNVGIRQLGRTQIDAAYVRTEITHILSQSNLKAFVVKEDLSSLHIQGKI
jgi:hypothetical protein